MYPTPIFYLAVCVLVSGPVAGLFLLFEWFHHKRKYAFMLAWALGLFLLDWFQIPTALSEAHEQIVYTHFNALFAISIPLSFLGFLLIYLGIRAVTHAPVRKITYVWFFLWFLAAVIFYSLQYWGAYPIESRLSLLASMAFLVVPVQVLNLKALWAGFRNRNALTTKLSRWGLVALMASVVVALARYAFYVDRVILYPPAFALLFIRSSLFYLATQVLGIVLLVVGFLLVHREAVRGRAQGPEHIVLGNQPQYSESDANLWVHRQSDFFRCSRHGFGRFVPSRNPFFQSYSGHYSLVVQRGKMNGSDMKQ